MVAGRHVQTDTPTRKARSWPAYKETPNRTIRPDGVATFSFFAASCGSIQTSFGIRPALGNFGMNNGTPKPPLAPSLGVDEVTQKHDRPLKATMNPTATSLLCCGSGPLAGDGHKARS
jgi:hypothetical protein